MKATDKRVAMAAEQVIHRYLANKSHGFRNNVLPILPNKQEKATDDKEAVAKRVSAQNAEHSAEWQELLACNTAADLDAISQSYSPVFYKVYKLMKGIMGHYDFDSRFYDTEAGSTARSYVDDRKGCAPDKQWITVFDLHN